MWWWKKLCIKAVSRVAGLKLLIAGRNGSSIIFSICNYVSLLTSHHPLSWQHTYAHTYFDDLNNLFPPSIIINSVTNIAKGVGKNIQHSSRDKEIQCNANFCLMFLRYMSFLHIEAQKWEIFVFCPYQWWHKRSSLEVQDRLYLVILFHFVWN